MVATQLEGALRQFLRAPVTSAVNLATLALGVACFIGAWAVTSYWSQSDAGFGQGDRVRVITQQFTGEEASTGPGIQTAIHAARYLREELPDLEAVGRLAFANSWTVAAGERSLHLKGSRTDAEFLRVFDFEFLHGDSRRALDAQNSVVLTEHAAQLLFGAANPVGEALVLDGEIETIVTGVLAEIPQPSHLGNAAKGFGQFDFLRSWPEDTFENGEWWLGVVGATYVLLPEQGTSRVDGDLEQVLGSLGERRVPADQMEMSTVQFGSIGLGELQARVLDTQLFRDSAGTLSVTKVLFGLGALVLLISCLNYANLATAQAARRAKEVGLRKVVGATRFQIMSQHGFEALLLTCLATAIAVGAVLLLSPLVRSYSDVDMAAALLNDRRLPLVLLAVVLLVTLGAAAYPALVLSGLRPVDAIRSGTLKAGSKWITQTLVGAQFAAASALLILVVVVNAQNSFMRDSALSEGADPVVLLRDAGSSAIDPELLQNRLSAEPALLAVGRIDYEPWSGFQSFIELTHLREASSPTSGALINNVGFGFFEAFDAELLAGRPFERSRDEPEAPEALPGDGAAELATNDSEPGGEAEEQERDFVLVDGALARSLGFVRPEDAIGSEVYLSRAMAAGVNSDPVFEIIGVADTVPLLMSGGGVEGNLYILDDVHSDHPVVRIDRERVAEGVAAIERVVGELAPEGTLLMSFTDGDFEESFRVFESINAGFVGLSLIAITIASLGLFALASYVAGRRRHEIGVRKTLGASVSSVVWLLLRDFSKPVLLANLVAWPLAYLGARTYLDTFMRRIDLTPVPWLIGLGVTLLIAWCAVGSQAWKAARVEPAEVLRND